MSRDGKKILEYIRTKISNKPPDLKRIVLTHAHVDHIRGAVALRKVTGAKIAIHVADSGYVSGRSKLPRPKGAIGWIFLIISPFFRTPKFEPDIVLKDGDNFSSSLTVLSTPGHTPGSISLYDKSRRALFVGDAILTRKGGLTGPPEQFTLSYQQALDSIERISKVDCIYLLSGHGEPVKLEGPGLLLELSKSLKSEA